MQKQMTVTKIKSGQRSNTRVVLTWA